MRTESNQRTAGAAFDERLRAAGAHRRLAPDPGYGGRPPVLLGTFIRRASSSQSPLYSGCPSVGIRHAAPLLLLSPPNPLRWALAGPPIKCPRCTGTAYSGITVAAGQLPGGDHRRTKQVGRHQAVCVRIQEPSNSDGKRPQWAENRRAHAQNLGRRNIPEVRRDTPP